MTDSPTTARPGGAAGVTGGAMVLGGLVAQEVGAALAVKVFPTAGPVGMVGLRMVFSAAVLLLVVRPRARSVTRRGWLVSLGYGAALGAMNLCFYAALSRLHLGTAVTFEVLGPLAVSVIAAWRWLSLLCAVVAGLGVALIGWDPRADLDPVGVGFALAAATLWAVYIVMTNRTGKQFAGLDGLVIGMTFAAIVIAPIALVARGTALLAPGVLAVGLGVALLSSALPYALEMLAARRLRTSTFAILLALSPVIASLVGLVVLSQGLSVAASIGVLLVVGAAIGASRVGTPPSVPPVE